MILLKNRFQLFGIIAVHAKQNGAGRSRAVSKR
jgi:hypothetical protein